MAFYLNTQYGLTEYQLGDFISNPVRAFFLVSDEELIEQDYGRKGLKKTINKELIC